MVAAIDLRTDFDGGGLRRLARRSKDAGQARRLLALAEIYESGSRSEAARLGGVTLQSIRDWVLRFNSHGPEGLVAIKAPGPESKLNDEQRHALKEIVEAGPIPAVHGVVRWRIVDLCQWIWEEFRVVVAKQTLSRELRAMAPGSSPGVSARPRHHAQAAGAIEDFKKACPSAWRRSDAKKASSPTP